jgi:uncharacterized protein YjbI with pentapeptide repeats
MRPVDTHSSWGGAMGNEREFWQRPVSDTLSIELRPGATPSLLINHNGSTVAQLKLSEARALAEVLTVAVGELFILQRDPSALAQLQRLLERDETLANGRSAQRSASTKSRISGRVKGHELLRRYREGRRSFPKADLRLVDLEGADLRQVDLSGADLSGANLKRANLFQANLEDADLSQANLEEAGLYQTNLRGADLRRANLHNAYLDKADLLGASITEEQLSRAKVFEGTVMPDGTSRD